MRKPALRDFIDETLRCIGSKSLPLGKSSFVSHPDFELLYARVCWRYEAGGVAIVLAALEASEPGRGAYRRLIKELRRLYPDYPIIAESVISERLAMHLIEHGWQNTDESSKDLYGTYILTPDVQLPADY